MLAQQIGFGLRINHAAFEFAGEFAVNNFQHIGVGIIDAELLLQAVGEEGETAGNQQKFHIMAFAFGNQVFRAGRQF